MQAATPAITIRAHLGGIQGEGEEVSKMQAVTPAITIRAHLGGIQGEGEEVSNAGSDPSHHH